ncbi:MAG: biopolymer transporter ExbD, partial [bacterium]
REIKAEKQLIVTVTDKNKIYVNKRSVKKESLEKELSVLLSHMSDKIVVLRADAGVKHGLVVELLDDARAAGAEKLAIATENKK